MNSSSAREERRRNGGGYGESEDYQRPAPATREAVAAPIRRRSPAFVGVPLVEAHLRAGHRRPQGRDPGVGVFAGEGDARKRQHRREHRRGQGGRQAAGGACGEERRHRSGVRSRRLSLSRPRQGARGCGARERIEFLNGLNWHRASQGKSFKDRKTPWQVNANAVAATGAAGKSATANSSTSSSTSIVWRRWSRASSASALRPSPSSAIRRAGSYSATIKPAQLPRRSATPPNRHRAPSPSHHTS